MFRLSWPVAAVAAALPMLLAFSAASAEGSFDGPYHGTWRLASRLITPGQGPAPCRGSSAGAAWTPRINNGVIHMAWNTGFIDLRVGGDGAISGAARFGDGATEVIGSGKVSGDTLTLEVHSPFCRYEGTATKG